MVLRTENGFTLVEVLITLLVLALGLLGLAATQATALKTTQSAYYRSQATQFAYDLADRMRVGYAYNPLSITEYYKFKTTASTAAIQNNCSNSTGCSYAELAENDWYEVYSKVSNVLPGGKITISRDATKPTVHTITVTWLDNPLFFGSDADRDTTAETSFSVSFDL